MQSCAAHDYDKQRISVTLKTNIKTNAYFPLRESTKFTKKNLNETKIK